jgi:ATP-dependent DNA helicase DinG
MVMTMTNKSSNEQISGLVNELTAYADKHKYTLRDKQSVYMQRWLDAMMVSQTRYDEGERSAGIVLAEAETGLGKTIGYALPMMAMSSVTGKRCAIATHSHLLQKQLLDGDLATINNWLEGCGRKRLKIARRVGKQAFVSASACESLIEDLNGAEGKGDVISFLYKLMVWAEKANEGKTSGLIDDALIDLEIDSVAGLPFGISKQSVALSGFSPDADFFAYANHVAVAADADIVLLTHHYLAAIALFKSGQNNFSSLVIDEADRLSGAIASMLHFDLSLRRFGRRLKELGLDDLAIKNEALIEATQQVFTEDEAIPMILVQENVRQDIFACAKEIHDELTVILSENKKQSKRFRNSDLEELRNVRKMMKKFNEVGASDKWNFWVSALSFSPTKKLPSIALMPRSPGLLLSKLWTWVDKESGIESDLSSVLLTSATMGIPGFTGNIRKSFSNFVREFALDSMLIKQTPMYSSWGQYEPTKFGQMGFVLADPSAPSPFIKTVKAVRVDDDSLDDKPYELNDLWVTYVSRMILEAAKNPKKRTLVLTRSYADNEAIALMIADKLGDRLILQKQNAGTKPAMLAFREKEGAVWLSPTAWEGIDLPGLINTLVIPRLPIPPDNALLRALLKGYSKYDDKGIDGVMAARRILMLKRLLRQGLGRPIRKHDDKCVVWFGDSRFPVPKMNQYLIEHIADGFPVNNSTMDLGYLIEVVPRRFQPYIKETSKKFGAPRIFFADSCS